MLHSGFGFRIGLCFYLLGGHARMVYIIYSMATQNLPHVLWPAAHGLGQIL